MADKAHCCLCGKDEFANIGEHVLLSRRKRSYVKQIYFSHYVLLIGIPLILLFNPY